MKTYTRISEEERNEIVVMLSRKVGINEIARRLGRNKGAISREINKNHGRKVYRANRAQMRAEIKQQESHKKTVLKSHALRIEVERLIQLRWSPELIAGRLKRNEEYPTISHESIYRWIFNERPDLINYLTRCSKEGRHYKRGRKPKSAEKIKERVDISQRPENINNRQETGHWETDLMEGQGQSCLKVSVERKGRFTKILKVPNKTSKESNKALLNMFNQIPQNFVKSITYDNGTENSRHMDINSILKTDSYFCRPYCSWEKGTVENTNGIIRRFLPKDTNFDNISDTQIQQLEFWLNNRPRKCMDYLTPQEVFNSTVALAT